MRSLMRVFLKIKFFIKGFLPNSLFGRSLLILVTPIFLVQAITTFMFFDRHWQKMGDRLAFSVANEIALIGNLIEKNDDPKNVAVIQENMEKPLDIRMRYDGGAALKIRFEDTKDAYQNASRESVIGETLARAFYVRLGRPFNITMDRDEKWVVVQVQLRNGVLTVELSERRIFSSSGYIVLLWMFGSSIILLVISTLFMRNQIKPIRKLAVAAERFGKGREVPFFKIEGAREVRQAARAFIGMKDRLGRQVQQRTTMLAGVSHDLRTPLTRMKLQLEMLGQDEAISGLKQDVFDMEKMIEAYLQFARGEGGEEPIRTDLKNIVERVVEPINRDENFVDVDLSENISLLLRPIAFERCLANVIGNALKYATHAWVSFKRVEANVEIIVDDNGVGVPPEQYEDVFKPFYRGESSRNFKTGGVGLGLPIVQDIVHAHGGVVWLDKSPKGGLRVVIELPL